MQPYKGFNLFRHENSPLLSCNKNFLNNLLFKCAAAELEQGNIAYALKSQMIFSAPWTANYLRRNKHHQATGNGTADVYDYVLL